ncbi:MAG: ABC transporter substrate-binding protein [Flavobacteriales bacterium]|nr:ABC transporter substrate-binding protein [Flavobacteriales bacterium]
MNLFKSVLSLAVILGSFAISCNTVAAKKNRKVFRYNESNGISSLDPAQARDLETMWATNQLFDGLVELDSSLQIAPSIAHSWKISEDGRSYIFYLRQNVLFHEDSCFGVQKHRNVRASDFVFSYRRILDSKTASPGKWIFAKIDTTMNGGFFAPSDSILHIYLKSSFQPFLGMLTTQYANVIPEEAVKVYGSELRSHPVGSGPFRFAFWYENESLVFHKNPNYWQKDEDGNQLPYLDAVQIDFVKDMNAEYQGVLKGTYDFMSGIHSSFKDELLDINGNLHPGFVDRIKLQKVPFIKTDYLGILVDPALEASSNSPLLIKKIRQAIAYAIDKDEMVARLRNNSVYPANGGFVPPALLPFETDTSFYSFNPVRAAQLLTEAGYPNGNGLGEIIISTTGDYTDLIEYIQHSLQKIGIKIRINVMQGNTFKDLSARGQLEMFRKSWLADYADAENFLSVFLTRNFSPTGPNYTHYSNPTFDSMYEEAAIEQNDILRLRLYQTMNMLAMEEAAVIPLFYDQVSHFVRNDISGLQTNPVNMLDLKWVDKKPE